MAEITVLHHSAELQPVTTKGWSKGFRQRPEPGNGEGLEHKDLSD
jgi:hypothetical protein